MSAVTPNIAAHEALPDHASRFVDVAAMPWEPTRFPGVQTKTLMVDPASGLLTALVKMEPGAVLPDHEHVRIEQTYVIEGSLADPEGTCGAGNFVWRPAGSRHEAYSPDGGVFLGIFQVPNKFYDENGELDMLGREWSAVWGDAANLKVTD